MGAFLGKLQDVSKTYVGVCRKFVEADITALSGNIISNPFDDQGAYMIPDRDSRNFYENNS